MNKLERGHNTLSIEFDIDEIPENSNPGIVRGVCKVAYAGKNRNYTNISKDAFEKAAETIYNTPVVGNWLGDNFGGHDIVMETRGNELIFKDTTIAYGVVPESARPRWEVHKDKFNDEIEYFVVDVLLWHERYPKEVEFIANNGVGQSMEIMVTDGDYDEESDYYNIDEFYFHALCLLGKDENNSDKHVEPCFEDANVEFGINENIAKQVIEFKQYIERSESVSKKFNAEEVVEKELIEEESTNEEVVDEEVFDDSAEIEEEVEAIEEDEKVEETEEEVEESEEEVEEVEEDDEKEEEDFTEVIQALETELASIKEENESLKSELDGYKEKETLREIDEVVSEFSNILSVGEIEQFTSKDNITAEVLRNELSVLFAKKQIEKAFKKEDNLNDGVEISIKDGKERVEAKDKFAIK